MRRDVLEDESNAERWMVSYADFITLLFGFFVVMYSISSVNNEKYKVLSDTLAQAFDTRATSPDPIQIGEPTEAASPHVVDIVDTIGYADQDPGNTDIVDPVEAAESLLGGFARQEGIALHAEQDWLELSLDASVLFAPGAGVLSDQASEVLTPVLELLNETTQAVTVEGYTDNVPSGSARYPSNWELSSARASSVARFLVDGGVRPERIAAVGYGENHPRETNATPEGRASNRRVMVVIARRGGLARNLNADGAATAVVRRAQEPAPPVEPRRTESGGLLFSNESESASS